MSSFVFLAFSALFSTNHADVYLGNSCVKSTGLTSEPRGGNLRLGSFWTADECTLDFVEPTQTNEDCYFGTRRFYNDCEGSWRLWREDERDNPDEVEPFRQLVNHILGLEGCATTLAEYNALLPGGDQAADWLCPTDLDDTPLFLTNCYYDEDLLAANDPIDALPNQGYFSDLVRPFADGSSKCDNGLAPIFDDDYSCAAAVNYIFARREEDFRIYLNQNLNGQLRTGLFFQDTVDPLENGNYRFRVQILCGTEDDWEDAGYTLKSCSRSFSLSEAELHLQVRGDSTSAQVNVPFRENDCEITGDDDSLSASSSDEDSSNNCLAILRSYQFGGLNSAQSFAAVADGETVRGFSGPGVTFEIVNSDDFQDTSTTGLVEVDYLCPN